MGEIFLTKIRIGKVRHLQDIDIKIDAQERKHLIITGKNGSGKTSLLNEILEMLSSHTPTQEAGEKLSLMKVMPDGKRIPSTTIFFSAPYHEIKKQCFDGNFILAYFKARREAAFFQPEGPEKEKSKWHFSITNEDAGKEFLQYLVNQKVSVYFAREQGNTGEAKAVEDFFKSFIKLLRDIFEDPDLRLEYDYKAFNFFIHTKGKDPFDLNQLADGYSAIISIVTDLLMRVEQYEQRHMLPGLVFIDEVETHLHVELQKKILPFLTTIFPNIQFVVTTHSPFVISSLSNAVIFDLEKRERVEDLSFAAYDKIVERYFDVDKYSQSVKTKVAEYEKLLKKQRKSSDDKERFAELEKELNEGAELAPELALHLKLLGNDKKNKPA